MNLPRLTGWIVMQQKRAGRDVSARIVQHVEIPADVGGKLSGVDPPIGDLWVGVAEVASVASCTGGVQRAAVVGVERS